MPAIHFVAGRAHLGDRVGFMIQTLKSGVRLALIEASKNIGTPDLPIGTVILDSGGESLFTGRNSVEQTGDPTAHAEMVALRQLSGVTSQACLDSLTIFSTLEPCPMCAWAIRSCGLPRLVYGASNPQYGAAGSVYDLLRDLRVRTTVEVIGGILQEECEGLLKDAFRKMRDNSDW